MRCFIELLPEPRFSRQNAYCEAQLVPILHTESLSRSLSYFCLGFSGLVNLATSEERSLLLRTTFAKHHHVVRRPSASSRPRPFPRSRSSKRQRHQQTQSGIRIRVVRPERIRRDGPCAGAAPRDGSTGACTAEAERAGRGRSVQGGA